ncbi:MAG: hypothetical protein JWP27_487, partial [Flaviaesturariibacter sp.]|nr:hypothetical protein [Flaviaesturariibacter sp.]
SSAINVIVGLGRQQVKMPKPGK